MTEMNRILIFIYILYFMLIDSSGQYQIASSNNIFEISLRNRNFSGNVFKSQIICMRRFENSLKNVWSTVRVS